MAQQFHSWAFPLRETKTYVHTKTYTQVHNSIATLFIIAKNGKQFIFISMN